MLFAQLACDIHQALVVEADSRRPRAADVVAHVLAATEGGVLPEERPHRRARVLRYVAVDNNAASRVRRHHVTDCVGKIRTVESLARSHTALKS